MVSFPHPETFIQVVDVHGSDPKADAGRAGEVAKMLYPTRRLLAVHPAGRLCRHGYPLWAVQVSGPDTRVAYVPGLSGPPIRELPEDNGVRDHCAVHGYEPIPARHYRVCGECMHVFVTAAELVEADRAMRVDCGLSDTPQEAEDIAVCPLCTHDF